jgi:thymidylate synthase ThyX
MSINDSGHRPHGTHYGETPQTAITYGPESIRVTLDTWGPRQNLFPTMYDMLQANWGDAPSRTVSQRAAVGDYYGWTALSPAQQAYVDKAFAGGTLPQVLEMLTFSFCIDGVTRAFTHQNVRTRIGAAFMQHGGRDNDWRHRAWTMPETIARAAGPHYPEEAAPWDGAKGEERRELKDKAFRDAFIDNPLKHCITDWGPLERYLDAHSSPGRTREDLTTAILDYLQQGKELYAALVDAGIPFQDARRVLPIGTQTYIHDIYSYPALKGVLGNRLEHVMDWEHNCVAQLMLRELNMNCPPVITKYLGSHSDRAGRAMFAGLDSWPPDGKYPLDICKCGHARANHHGQMNGEELCEVCQREGNHATACARFVARTPLTFHRPEQNPFWVLTPAAMAGGPVEWIATNGTYPHDRLTTGK